MQHPQDWVKSRNSGAGGELRFQKLVRPSHRKAERISVSLKAGNPTCFSEVPPGWQHSTQSPVEWEWTEAPGSHGSHGLPLARGPIIAAALIIWSLPSTACTHQVEVGEDTRGPVLLGHE